MRIAFGMRRAVFSLVTEVTVSNGTVNYMKTKRTRKGSSLFTKKTECGLLNEDGTEGEHRRVRGRRERGCIQLFPMKIC